MEQSPNELWLVIYSYLHKVDILYSFTELNNRFEQLITPYRYDINLSDTSIKLFKRFIHNVLPSLTLIVQSSESEFADLNQLPLVEKSFLHVTLFEYLIHTTHYPSSKFDDIEKVLNDTYLIYTTKLYRPVSFGHRLRNNFNDDFLCHLQLNQIYNVDALAFACVQHLFPTGIIDISYKLPNLRYLSYHVPTISSTNPKRVKLFASLLSLPSNLNWLELDAHYSIDIINLLKHTIHSPAKINHLLCRFTQSFHLSFISELAQILHHLKYLSLYSKAIDGYNQNDILQFLREANDQIQKSFKCIIYFDLKENLMMKWMIMRFYFIYLLNFGIYVLPVHSYGDNNMDMLDENQREESIENSHKLHRVKRVGQPGTAPMDSSPESSTDIDLPSHITLGMSSPASSPPMTTQLNTNITYNFTSLVTTERTTQFTSPINSSISTHPTSLSTNTTVTITSTTTNTLNTTSSYNPDTCNNSTFIKLYNGTCVSKPDAQMIAYGMLRNSSIDATDTVRALSLYISSVTNSTMPLNQTNTLSVDEIDNAVGSISGVNLTINSNTSFVAAFQPDQGSNRIILGASFVRGIGGDIIDTSNIDNVTKSFVSVAALVSKESLSGVISLNMLIVDKPTGYENIDNSTNKTLASSVIVADVKRNSSIIINPVTIYLYFSLVSEYKQTGQGKYLCSFYDTNSSIWNEFGCGEPQYNAQLDRYECSCNHLTCFALVWLPQSLSTTTTNTTRQLDAQDIASLVFQSLSILCFLAIITHAIFVRIINSTKDLQASRLLPLISTASTTLLFIFFIALSTTVFTQTASSDQTECFLSSSILMFITYFFLIFMFCAKTCIGYFYYLRFVRLYPYLSNRQLVSMLFISLFIAISCVVLAIGFNSKASYSITQLYPYQLCWFTHEVVYYFMAIPTGIFLVLNILTIILVTKSIITHAYKATSAQQIEERLKRCVIVLLSSCVTQGIGWLLGPFISFASPTAAYVLEWFFIIFNGLEGVWSILLYVLIRRQRVDEQKRVTNNVELSKLAEIPSNKTLVSNVGRMDGQVTQRNIGKERPNSFDDLRESKTLNWFNDDVDK